MSSKFKNLYSPSLPWCFCNTHNGVCEEYCPRGIKYKKPPLVTVMVEDNWQLLQDPDHKHLYISHYCRCPEILWHSMLSSDLLAEDLYPICYDCGEDVPNSLLVVWKLHNMDTRWP